MSWESHYTPDSEDRRNNAGDGHDAWRDTSTDKSSDQPDLASWDCPSPEKVPWGASGWDEDGTTDDDDGAPKWEWNAFSGAPAPSILERIRSWAQGRSADEDSESETELGASIDEARDRLDHYQSCGQADRHSEYLADSRYRGSLEYALASAVILLEQRLNEYDADMRSASACDLANETSGCRVGVLNAAIGMAETIRERLMATTADLKQRWAGGQIGWAAYDSRMEALRKRETMTIRQLDMGGLGMTMGDISEISDQSSHILEDGLAEDDGEMRQKIAQKIRSMPRWMALEIIRRAVEDGIISQTTADYLIREYVRSR